MYRGDAVLLDAPDFLPSSLTSRHLGSISDAHSHNTPSRTIPAISGLIQVPEAGVHLPRNLAGALFHEAQIFLETKSLLVCKDVALCCSASDLPGLAVLCVTPSTSDILGVSQSQGHCQALGGSIREAKPQGFSQTRTMVGWPHSPLYEIEHFNICLPRTGGKLITEDDA